MLLALSTANFLLGVLGPTATPLAGRAPSSATGRLKWNQPMAEDLADRRKRFKRATSTRVTLTNGEPLTGHRVTWPLTDDAAMVSKRATSGVYTYPKTWWWKMQFATRQRNLEPSNHVRSLVQATASLAPGRLGHHVNTVTERGGVNVQSSEIPFTTTLVCRWRKSNTVPTRPVAVVSHTTGRCPNGVRASRWAAPTAVKVSELGSPPAFETTDTLLTLAIAILIQGRV